MIGLSPCSDDGQARHQLGLRLGSVQERPGGLLEAAVLDLMALGRVRTPADRLAAVEAVTPGQLRDSFAAMLGAGVAGGLSGSLKRGDAGKAEAALAPLLSGRPIDVVRSA